MIKRLVVWGNWQDGNSLVWIWKAFYENARKLGVRLKFSETPEGFALAAADEEGFAASISCMPGKTRAEKPE